MLTLYQLDLANKIVEALKPIEEITKEISADSTSISVIIPLVRMLVKTLEKHHNDSGIRTLKKEMLTSLQKRFEDIEENQYTVISTLLDPCFKNKFFTGSVQMENAKMLLREKFDEMATSNKGAPENRSNDPVQVNLNQV